MVEEQGERYVSGWLLPFLEDARLARLAARHASDEARHAAGLRLAARRTGVEPAPVPRRLEILAGLDDALRGGLTRAPRDRTEAGIACLILQVLEERSVRQFEIFARAFARADPHSAALFRDIARGRKPDSACAR